MILYENQIIDLVKNPENPVLSENKKIQDNHKVHIQGTGFEAVLNKIIGYDDVESFRNKKLITKPFTRLLFKKIRQTHGRWNTAWGTSKFYSFKESGDVKVSESFKRDVLSQVWKGKSIDSFISNFLFKALYEEFNGFISVERPAIVIGENGTKYAVKDGIQSPIVNDSGAKPYLCFICVEDVHNFKLTGEKVEFIVIKYGTKKVGNKEIKLFRVIDDKYDYIVEKDGDKVKLSEEFPRIEHKAGSCPVSCVTHINKYLTNDNTKTSPVDEIIEWLDAQLNRFGEHLVSEILHAHPKYFEVATRCTYYEGGSYCDNGEISYEKDGESIKKTCPSCNGLGHPAKKDASRIMILPAVNQNGDTVNISTPAGYITPPIDILQYQQQAIDWMENKILDGALGQDNVRQTDSLDKTATAAKLNLKPLEQIISEIIDILESVETALTDFIGRIYYGDRYLGCEIIYDRKLSLRDENSLLDEISSSKSAGVSNSHLKSLNEELTYSRFVRSNYDLSRNVILNELEPLIGYTFDEVEKSTSIPEQTKKLKQNFNDLIQRFEEENGDLLSYMPGMDLRAKVKLIREVLNKYTSELTDVNKAETNDLINNQN